VVYLRLLRASILGQLQYRASFIMMAAGQFTITLFEFLAIAALFARFGSLRDWKLPEVALLYGMINVSFAVAEAAARGFDLLPQSIRSGELDRLLLRPRSVLLQLAAQELQIFRAGRLLQGAAVLGWAISKLGVVWTCGKVVLLAASLAGGTATFVGLFVLQGTLSFWTVETLELMNTVTYGGTETAQYPVTIYKPWFRGFFTFVVPLACANFFPAELIIGRSGSVGSLAWLAPLVGFFFLGLCSLVFQLGLRHYSSTGS
jgi:ABC-2 type transport system permease protein